MDLPCNLLSQHDPTLPASQMDTFLIATIFTQTKLKCRVICEDSEVRSYGRRGSNIPYCRIGFSVHVMALQ